MSALRIDKPIVLDGCLDDAAWRLIDPERNFLQTVPYNGEPATERTEVRILYDDDALYIGAMLFDSAPDSIRKGLGERDCADDAIDADHFVVELNPYNDNLQLFDFKVSSSNVQVDEKVNFDSWDSNWDAVWYSKTRMLENGWSVEMKIPFSALRIPAREEQVWGLQLLRHIKRKSEWSSWNYFDESIHGATQQVGTLKGIKDIKPPVRLSITPYLSGYYDKLSDQKDGDFTMRGGLDLKYGINKSYTLDLMLIPDFGQTASDDKVLNLSTVETQYNEKRSYFTEGTELFGRADLFYSRRIGGTPIYKDDAWGKIDSNEVIVKNPNEAQLINSTKLTGRSSDGLAVGFLSATSLEQFATINDTLKDVERKVTTQPVTHYGVLVVDQALKNNSYVSLINTHVSYFEEQYKLANVIGTDFKLSNASGGHTLWFKSGLSYLDKSSKSTGAFYDYTFAKTKGQFRYAFDQKLRSKEYDCRDLGYLDERNHLNNSFRLQYNHYVAKRFFLNWFNTLTFVNNYHLEPFEYSMFEIYFESFMTLKNNMGIGLYFGGTPVPKYDFNEPRVNGWKYKEPTAGYFGGNYRTNKNNRVWVYIDTWYWQDTEYDRFTYHFNLRPTFNATDKLKFALEFDFERGANHLGWVENNSVGDTIIFGRRIYDDMETIVETEYLFTANSSLRFRGRYYWSGVEYKQFYILKEDGTMNDNQPFLEGRDVNYTTFNIDLSYTWRFAPGSELSLMWKNSITGDDNIVADNYRSNFTSLLENTQLNTLSFRVLYYLDYNYLRKKRS